MSDDSMAESVFEDSGGSDFEPEEAPKPKAKAAKKAAPKASPKKPQKKAAAKPAAKGKKKAKADDENEISDRDDPFGDDSVLSQTPPKKSKAVAFTKKGDAGKEPLAEVANENSPPKKNGKKGKPNASARYRRKTEVEHILAKPGMYTGPINVREKEMWVYDSTSDSMVYRPVTFVPGLYKLLDELLVNAADNKENCDNMDEIRVDWSRETGVISVWNNGDGIPVEIHEEEEVWIPFMIFGQLRTGSNYSDDEDEVSEEEEEGQQTKKKVPTKKKKKEEEERITGGTNGLGAKLVNIFSHEFTVETQDSNTKKRFKQTWRNHMTEYDPEKITAAKGADFTRVTYRADDNLIRADGISEDMEAVMMRRCYDLAATTGVTVKVNGTKLNCRNFKKYMEMFAKAIHLMRDEGDSKPEPVIYTVPHERWEVGFAVSDGTFKQISFVNSINTYEGGAHVDIIADQICKKLSEVLKKNKKGTGSILKPAQIKNYCFLFIKATINKPEFTNQAKHVLDTKASEFGSKPVLDDAFLNKIAKSGALNYLKRFADVKADQAMKKGEGGRRSRISNAKLTDANKAGTKDGHLCTLILTEGESAKGLAMAGRGVVGADFFGVYPLRGKILNVRDATYEQISGNVEIQNIKKFMGLQHKKEYTDVRELRYGHLMIMTDQDHDGSHIKGLLINYLNFFYPSVLKIPGFLVEFITPIVKVWKGDPKNPTKSIPFYTLHEYEDWRQVPGNERGWEYKYYKGLGTSSAEEAQDYFRDLDQHLKEFAPITPEEVPLIELAFAKKNAEARRAWMRSFKQGTFMDHSVSKITYSDFINKELIQFSLYDCARSVPSVVDGLKPSQRKVMYTTLKRNMKKDVKVLDLTGQVFSIAAYHHGDSSLHTTIIGLAQDFVGSNNVKLLEPSGNFGSRLRGGGDASSARYIHTRLSPFARRIFHPHDDPILTHCEDDGKMIEPEFYVPVVPLLLINGAHGIGTGWASHIPKHNPEDVVDNLRRMMKGEEPQPMTPWYKGFKGEIVRSTPTQWKWCGSIKQINDKELELTELGVEVWTTDFVEKLETMMKAEKTPCIIKDYKDYNTQSDVHMILQLEPKNIKEPLTQEVLQKIFGSIINETMSTQSYCAFDPEGRITKYASIEDIVKEFFLYRLKLYERRKQWQLDQMHKELLKLTNQARFVQMIIDGELVVSKKKKAVLVTELKEKDFTPFPKVSEAVKAGETEKVVEASDDEAGGKGDKDESSSAYDYLLGMAIWSLTQERVERLRRQIGDKEIEIVDLSKLSKEDIWNHDLDEFINEWRFSLAEADRRSRGISKKGRRVSAKLPTAKAAGGKKRKAAADDSDEDFVAAKSKKKAAPKNAAATGGIMSFLNKASKPTPATSEKESDDEFDFEKEVMPKKSRGPAKASPKPKDEDGDVDMGGSDAEIVPQKSRAAPKAAPKPKEEDDEDSKPKAAPKRGRAAAAAKAKPKPKDEDSDALEDDDFMEITKAEAAKTAPATSRAGRKTATKYALSDSDSDSGEDMLGDVSKMVKGIGGANGGSGSDSRQLFSELSRPSSSTGLPTSAKTSKFSNEFDPDETDYSKLIPQNSPRRSLQVKPKEKASDSVDPEDDDAEEEPVKPAKGKAAASKAAPKTAPKTTAAKGGRGRPKKDAAPAASSATKQTTLSPAAKAYASKQAKAAPKKKTIMDDSDDDIDAMANDILDSPAGPRDEPSARSTGRAAASRSSRRTNTTKKSYVIEDDDSEDGGDADAQDDSFDMSE